MGKKHYEWVVSETPPKLGAHSIAKHNVLAAYLEKYVAVVAARKVQEQLKITLVDGFCGGGAYCHWETSDLLPGSPFIMYEAMQRAERDAQAGRHKPFRLDVEFFFIDENPQTIAYLKNEFSDDQSARIYSNVTNVLCENFSTQLDRIIARIKQRQRMGRAIFLLDQYGYTDVPMSDIRKIFRELPKAEVILTVATDWLITYWNDDTVRNLGLEFPSGILESVKGKNPVDWRREIQFRLHKEFHDKSGAGYYTPFFIVSPNASRSYWLLHFSAHPKARDVMTELHWELQNHFTHPGHPGLSMLGYHPRFDNERLGYQTFNFDSVAATASHDALMQELPKVIEDFPDGISLNLLFRHIVNQTPATKAMLAKAVRDLNIHDTLQLISNKGKLRRKDVQADDNDIIRLQRQRRLFLPAIQSNKPR